MSESKETSIEKVVMDETVMREIRRHGSSSLQAEVCGILIGKEADGVTTVTACIAGEHAAEAGAQVTFTQETWEHVYKIKDEQYPEEAIVGWYHTHPGFGIFLSKYDLFIHENFFAAPHQVAWVFDPLSLEEGCFAWKEGKVTRLPEVVERFERRPTESPTGEAQPPDEASASDTGASDPTELEKRRRLANYGLFGLTQVLVIGISCLLGYFAATKSKTEAPLEPPPITHASLLSTDTLDNEVQILIRIDNGIQRKASRQGLPFLEVTSREYNASDNHAEKLQLFAARAWKEPILFDAPPFHLSQIKPGKYTGSEVSSGKFKFILPLSPPPEPEPPVKPETPHDRNATAAPDLNATTAPDLNATTTFERNATLPPAPNTTSPPDANVTPSVPPVTKPESNATPATPKSPGIPPAPEANDTRE